MYKVYVGVVSFTNCFLVKRTSKSWNGMENGITNGMAQFGCSTIVDLFYRCNSDNNKNFVYINRFDDALET